MECTGETAIRSGQAPWGLPTIRFPGQYYDAEAGLHYNRFRYYDPSIGRYISADPIGQFGLIAPAGLAPIGAGANVYSYVLSDPIDLADPLGLSAVFISIKRKTTGPNSTIGDLSVNGTPIGNTLEPPWKDNKSFESSIPPGTYFASTIQVEKFSGTVLLLTPTGSRTGILFHRGNIPDDTSGCILPGKSAGQDSVSGSETALNEILDLINFTRAVDAASGESTDIIVTIE